MALPLPLSPAADLFVETVSLIRSTTTQNPAKPGRWFEVFDSPVNISGVIQTSDAKKTKIDSDGAISEGTLMLHTRVELEAYDVNQGAYPPTPAQVRTQAYVQYGGEMWRVDKTTDWLPKTGGYFLYYLTKYVSIGGI